MWHPVNLKPESKFVCIGLGFQITRREWNGLAIQVKEADGACCQRLPNIQQYRRPVEWYLRALCRQQNLQNSKPNVLHCLALQIHPLGNPMPSVKHPYLFNDGLQQRLIDVHSKLRNIINVLLIITPSLVTWNPRERTDVLCLNLTLCCDVSFP